MTEERFYQDLLALPRLNVTAVEISQRCITVEGHIEVKAKACPVCGEPTALLNQYDTRKVQDLSISGKEVYLHLRIPQLVCTSCPRYFTTVPEWIMPGKSYTRRQAKWIFELCAKQPFTEVAALVNLSHKTVERLYYEMAQEQIDLPGRYGQVRKLGIDEVAHRKGKRDFVCVLTDLERGIQLDVLPDRKKATLKAHFEGLGADFCQQIEVVACDMWSPYRDVAEQCFPNAEVVVDRFHVAGGAQCCPRRAAQEFASPAPPGGSLQGNQVAAFQTPGPAKPGGAA
jgi:transposase